MIQVALSTNIFIFFIYLHEKSLKSFRQTIGRKNLLQVVVCVVFATRKDGMWEDELLW